ncbi:MAG: TrbI/VirB10 family protein [Pseudomonadota bacterium]
MADVPPPPENPFESSSNEYDMPQLESNGEGNGSEQDLPEGTPAIAAKAGRAFIVLGIVGAAVLLLLYLIFSGDKKEEVKEVKKPREVAPKEYEPPPVPIAPPVIAPPLTSLTPPPIPQPVTVPNTINLNPLVPKDDSTAKAEIATRMRSSIMIKEGGGGEGGIGSLLGGNKPAAGQSNNPNSAFLASVSSTTVEQVEATRISNLRNTIAQGRIIQATMESALNTDLPAPIRAIVSRDTYGEAGTVPLIPKGSRLIGSYNNTLTNGQTRVFVVWTRVIRPDGVDVMLGSPLVDGIGQAGVSGQIDTKFQQIFARSLMSSVMNIALAIGSDEITGGTTTTSNSAIGGTQTSGDAATTATTNALNRLGSVTDSFIKNFMNVPPTILVDQGTIVNVFVNKDLVFPSDASNGVRIVN